MILLDTFKKVSARTSVEQFTIRRIKICLSLEYICISCQVFKHLHWISGLCTLIRKDQSEVLTIEKKKKLKIKMSLTSMTNRSKALQSSVKTVQFGLFNLKACAAGSSFSIAHQDSATPDWCRPSDNPESNKKKLIALYTKCLWY